MAQMINMVLCDFLLKAGCCCRIEQFLSVGHNNFFSFGIYCYVYINCYFCLFCHSFSNKEVFLMIQSICFVTVR